MVLVRVELVICTGAAGSLAPQLSVGDVVVGTETVEHDYRLLFATRPLPRFPGHQPSIEALRRSARGISDFRVAFDVIASGDEDVVTSSRARAIRDQTGAVRRRHRPTAPPSRTRGTAAAF